MGVGTVCLAAHSLVLWWHGFDWRATFFLAYGGARINYLSTCLKARRLPLFLCCGRKIYVIKVPVAQQQIHGAFAGAHLTFACLHRHVDYFRSVQAPRCVSMLACT